MTVPTTYGRLDCLLERGRRDWDRLRVALAVGQAPLGLINGTRYRSTARPPWHALEPVQPPLNPFRVLTALERLAENPDVSDAEILAIVGPPDFLTDCDISGDLAALAAGRQVTLRLTGRVTIADQRHLIIESLPRSAIGQDRATG